MPNLDGKELGELPVVSVVIPTRNRPQLLLRAVESVINQTYRNLDIVVVIDGPDTATPAALAAIQDHRLRVIHLEESAGGSEARNIGARAGLGKWIALLDDDDEWRADKIEKQVEAAEKAQNPYVLVFSRMIVRFPAEEYTWPQRLPEPTEAMSDYLFVRKGLSYGEGCLQTSSFFASKTMMLEVPFTKGQLRFQDTDWILRASAHPSATRIVIDEPLVVYYMDDTATVSRKPDWKYLYDWAKTNRQYFTPRAYSFMLATQCMPRAAKQKEPFSVFLKLLRESIFDGSPTLNCIAVSIVFWFMPEQTRHKLRDLLKGSKRSDASSTAQNTVARSA